MILIQSLEALDRGAGRIQRHYGYTRRDATNEHPGPSFPCSFRVVSKLIHSLCHGHTQNEPSIRPLCHTHLYLSMQTGRVDHRGLRGRVKRSSGEMEIPVQACKRASARLRSLIAPPNARNRARFTGRELSHSQVGTGADPPVWRIPGVEEAPACGVPHDPMPLGAPAPGVHFQDRVVLKVFVLR